MAKLSLPPLSGEHISEQELAVYRALRPYIAHCLSLNHEINNPLAGIVGYTEFLIEECQGLSPEHQNFLRQIMVSAERIQRIVEELCAEKIALHEKIDLASLVRELEPYAHPSD